jgi:hypothetical protein
MRIPIKATARVPIKQAGYISATSATTHNLSCEMQPVHTLGHSLPIHSAPIPADVRYPRKRHDSSPPSVQGRLVLLCNRGVRPCKTMPNPSCRHPSGYPEQRETDRRQAAATAETRLGDPDQAPDRATNARSGYVQSGHRQQIARVRCRRYQDRGCGFRRSRPGITG